MNDKHFKMIFWFVVGVTTFAAILSITTVFIPVPKSNERFADTAIVFWLSTGAGGCIGYLIGSSVAISRKNNPITINNSENDIQN